MQQVAPLHGSEEGVHDVLDGVGNDQGKGSLDTAAHGSSSLVCCWRQRACCCWGNAAGGVEAPQEPLQNQVHEAEPVLEPEEVDVAAVVAVKGELDRDKEVDRHDRGGQGRQGNASWPSSERRPPHLKLEP